MIKKVCIMMIVVLVITFVGQAALAVEVEPAPTRKEPLIAGVASLIIPGLGQAYVQDWEFSGKPITHFAVSVGLYTVGWVLAFTIGYGSGLAWLAGGLWTLYSAIDAVSEANKYNAKYHLSEVKPQNTYSLNLPQGVISLGSVQR